jgi:hypothetical protein
VIYLFVFWRETISYHKEVYNEVNLSPVSLVIIRLSLMKYSVAFQVYKLCVKVIIVI